MKKILLVITLCLWIPIVNAFEARPFVIADITTNDIIISDIQTSLVSIKIDKSTIQGTIPDIDPGVIAMISCTPDRKIQLQNANNLQVAAFNSNFEQIALFFE